MFTAANPAGCGVPEGLGAEGGETRYGTPRYDNVNDYHGFGMLGSIQDFSNATISGLAGYSAQVSVSNGGTDFPAAVPAAEALRITVTVTGPANVQVVLQGYRLRYAPNSP